MVQTIPGKSDISKETKKRKQLLIAGLYTVNLPRLFTAVFTAVRLTMGIPWSRSTIYRTVKKPYNLQETVPNLPYIPFRPVVVFAENRINMYHIPF